MGALVRKEESDNYRRQRKRDKITVRMYENLLRIIVLAIYLNKL